MRYVKVEDAVGKKLGYDVMVEGGKILERGYVIKSEDIDKLKNSGLYYVWIEEGEEEKDLMYEWEITPYVASKIVGENVEIRQGKQGSTMLYSKVPGIINVDVDALVGFNINQKVLLITRYKYEGVGRGELIGIVDVIPLSMPKAEVEDLVKNRKVILDVIPFKYRKVGVVITGTEIYEGRKKDLYMPVIEEKAKKYEWEIVYHEIVPDDEEKIAKAILNAKNAGSEGILVTGGTSVDPTDKTAEGIKKTGAKIFAYGIPMKPTTMTIVAMLDSTPVVGVSGGGIHFKDYNAIDKIFTRLMTGLTPNPVNIAEIGHGGLSWNFLQTTH